MANPIVIFGSSRERGDTWKAIHMVLLDRKVPVVSLGELNFSSFDYDYNNSGDDFPALAARMIGHDTFILATPVYWYTMSAIMKSFIDRWNDFTTHTKDVGRQMRGKTLGVITSYSVHPDGKEGFEPIFLRTSNYLGFKYGGCFFHYGGDDQALRANNAANARLFAERILDSVS